MVHLTRVGPFFRAAQVLFLFYVQPGSLSTKNENKKGSMGISRRFKTRLSPARTQLAHSAQKAGQLSRKEPVR